MAATKTQVTANNAGVNTIEDAGNGIGAVHAIIDSAALPTGAATSANQTTEITSLAPLLNFGAGEYETVAASQTAQVLGGTGAVGDYISGLLVTPTTVDAGNVILLDNAISMTVFAGGTGSVSNLVPFFIPLGLKSVSGALKVTTGANVSVIAIGNFT